MLVTIREHQKTNPACSPAKKKHSPSSTHSPPPGVLRTDLLPSLHQRNLRRRNNVVRSHVASLDPCRVRPVLLGESALARPADQLGRAPEERVPSRAAGEQRGHNEGHRRLRAARLRGSPELVGSHDSLGLCRSDGQGYGSGRAGHELVCVRIPARARGVHSFIHLHRDPHAIFLPNCCFHGETAHFFSFPRLVKPRNGALFCHHQVTEKKNSLVSVGGSAGAREFVCVKREIAGHGIATN